MRESEINPRRSAILAAALKTFTQYGYRKTTMGDLAQAAGLSRPALYLQFSNKTELYREGFLMLMNEAEASMSAGFRQPGDLLSRLHKGLISATVDALRAIAETPHGMELFELKDEIARDLAEQWFGGIEQALAHELQTAIDAGELTPPISGVDGATLARLIVAAIEGVKKRRLETGGGDCDWKGAEQDIGLVLALMLQRDRPTG